MSQETHVAPCDQGWCLHCGTVRRGPFRTKPLLLQTWDDQVAQDRCVRLCKWEADGIVLWTRDIYRVLPSADAQLQRSLFVDPVC